MSTASTPHHVGAREIVALLAWCRRLSVAGPDADPTERAAYLVAKTDLLTGITACITDPVPDPTAQGHDQQEQR